MAAVASDSLFADATMGAVFSPCRTWRYVLWRRWDERAPCVFIMLNPSTADETLNDATITRCIKRAKALACGALVVVNLFALRSTDPRALYDNPEPVGVQNDGHIEDVVREAVERGGVVICAWGAHGKLRDRGEAVRLKLLQLGAQPRVLAINADGTPKHPLYVAMDQQPQVWG